MKKIIALFIPLLLVGCSPSNSTSELTYTTDDRYEHLGKGNHFENFNAIDELKSHVKTKFIDSSLCENFYLLNDIGRNKDYWSTFTICYDLSDSELISNISVIENYSLIDSSLGNTGTLPYIYKYSLTLTCIFYPCVKDIEYKSKVELIDDNKFKITLTQNSDTMGYVYVYVGNSKSMNANIDFMNDYLKDNLISVG